MEKVALNELIQDTEIENLQLLTSGPIPPNPSELLGSALMESTLAELRKLAEIIIIDAPPTIAVTDASVLASKVDGVILVIVAGENRPEMAQKAKKLLVKAQGKILGVVLNKVEIEEEHAYYYYYYGADKKKSK